MAAEDTEKLIERARGTAFSLRLSEQEEDRDIGALIDELACALASEEMTPMAVDMMEALRNSVLFERAYKALEPFATAARGFSPELPGDTEVQLRIGERTVYVLALGSLRAARAALSEQNG